MDDPARRTIQGFSVMTTVPAAMSPRRWWRSPKMKIQSIGPRMASSRLRRNDCPNEQGAPVFVDDVHAERALAVALAAGEAVGEEVVEEGPADRDEHEDDADEPVHRREDRSEDER